MKFSSLPIVLLVILSLTISSAAQKKPEDSLVVRENITTAQNLLKSGDAAGAVKILQAILQSNPQNESVKFWLGKSFYTQGDYQKAIENLNLLADKFPKDSPEQMQTVQMLGLSHYILGHLAEAIPNFEKLVQWQPENNEVAYALGVSYIQTRQPEKSRQTFAKLFSVPTNSASAYLLNAQMHVRQQFEETAEVELNKALALDPKLAQVRFVLGELAIYHAEIDKGVELLKQEIALNPSNSMAYYRLGEGLSRQLKWDEAIPPLQKSIWLNPFFSGPYIVLGKVYLKKQDLGNAENMLRRSTTIDPNNFGAHYLLAQVLQQTGKVEEAKTEFALAEKLRGNSDKLP
jgi:tetratricopeptide (TPR) repeat protein